MQAVKHPSADAVTQNGHKFDTTAAITLCQLSKTNYKIKMAPTLRSHIKTDNANRLADPENLYAYARIQII